jgi:formylmethanofuran dehydrogenase subunit C
MSLQFTLRKQPEVPLEAEALTPDRLAGLDTAALAAVPVMHGNRPATVGEYFDIQTAEGADDVIRFDGDLSRIKRIGEGMTRGRIVINGAAGMHLGAAMSGGEIEVNGDAGDWVGAEMAGGRIMVRGNAGHQIGSVYRGGRKGMTGGELIVFGNAGAEIGNGMRRGLLAIGGNSGDFTGVNMLAGTVVVLGEMGWRAGAGMTRGSIVSMRPARVLPTFTFDCVYRPTFLRMYLLRLRALGLPITDAQLDGDYKRWSGDHIALGRGELLIQS